MSQKTDTIFSNNSTEKGEFKFDQRVAKVFADMISRSVPGYQQVLKLLPTVTRQFASNNSHYYDLGCSLGAGMLAMAQGLNKNNGTVIGIDNSSAMIEQANSHLAILPNSDNQDFPKLELICDDICKTPLHPCAMALMNFTLQFIPLDQRSNLIQRIFDALKPGGALILSEKLTFAEQDIDQLLIRLHHQFKADQGYSQLEISRKRDAIENVLIPETLDVHTQRLKSAGFKTVTTWLQHFQFVSLIAVK